MPYMDPMGFGVKLNPISPGSTWIFPGFFRRSKKSKSRSTSMSKKSKFRAKAEVSNKRCPMGVVCSTKVDLDQRGVADSMDVCEQTNGASKMPNMGKNTFLDNNKIMC